MQSLFFKTFIHYNALERNHNIRIPGFASDDTRISLAQSSLAPYGGAGNINATSKKQAAGAAAGGPRSQRLNQVAQAKRDGKLI